MAVDETRSNVTRKGVYGVLTGNAKRRQRN